MPMALLQCLRQQSISTQSHREQLSTCPRSHGQLPVSARSALTRGNPGEWWRAALRPQHAPRYLYLSTAAATSPSSSSSSNSITRSPRLQEVLDKVDALNRMDPRTVEVGPYRARAVGVTCGTCIIAERFPISLQRHHRGRSWSRFSAGGHGRCAILIATCRQGAMLTDRHTGTPDRKRLHHSCTLPSPIRAAAAAASLPAGVAVPTQRLWRRSGMAPSPRASDVQCRMQAYCLHCSLGVLPDCLCGDHCPVAMNLFRLCAAVAAAGRRSAGAVRICLLPVANRLGAAAVR